MDSSFSKIISIPLPVSNPKRILIWNNGSGQVATKKFFMDIAVQNDGSLFTQTAAVGFSDSKLTWQQRTIYDARTASNVFWGADYVKYSSADTQYNGYGICSFVNYNSSGNPLKNEPYKIYSFAINNNILSITVVSQFGNTNGTPPYITIEVEGVVFV